MNTLLKERDASSRPNPASVGLRRPPRLSKGIPFLGHSFEFVKSTIELLFRAQKELGEVASFNVFNRKIVAMFGPEAHEAVFRAPDAQLSPTEAYKIMTPIFGKDVIYDASPEKMAEQVKMFLPALRDRRMRTYGEAVVYETTESIRPWGESGILDFVHFCRILTSFTSSRCLLGKEFREGMSEEFAAVYHDLEKGAIPLAYINAHLPIPAFKKRDRARVHMVEMITSIVQARRRESREGEDFLQTLMESHYSDGKTLSEHEITGLLLAGIFAGHHTSSVTTAWTLIELLSNPEYLKRTIREIDTVFGDGKPVTYESLKQLVVTENAVKESLRLHPPLFMLVRVAKEDFVYKDYLVPKGSWVVVSPTVAHRMPEVFQNPDQFDPDRFAPPREEEKKNHFGFIAFGGGRHKCVGNAFAILQIKAILAMLLGQYDFEMAGDPIHSDFHGLVASPKEPFRLRYRLRERPSVHPIVAAELSKMSESSGGCPVHANASPVKDPVECPVKSPVKNKDLKQMTIELDHDLCQGHSMCVGEAPEVFRIGSHGKVEVILKHPPVELHEKVREAAKCCPTRTIRIQEVENDGPHESQ